MNVQPFTLSAGDSQNLSVTTSSASITLTAAQQSSVARIFNSGGSNAAVRAVSSTNPNQSATADATKDLQIPAGGVETFSITGCDTISAICPTGSTTLNISFGEGQ